LRFKSNKNLAMRVIKYLFILALLVYSSGIFFSCRDEDIDLHGDVSLTFSTDTLLFDTIFTTVGSATRSFKVYNNNNKRIKISTIQIGSGQNSYFRVNVNGVPGHFHQDIEIAPNDSIFIFAEVTLDPANSSLPLVIVDSLIFVTNNKTQDVKLAAWGQDAIFFNANYPVEQPVFHLLTENTIWNYDKPIVVYSTIVAAPGVILEIEQGTNVHLHSGKSIYFLDNSTLKANGTLENPVIFQGDRLEQFFQDKPGQWGRIFFSPQSHGHEINYAIIKNGTVGLHIGSNGNSSGSNFLLKNSIVKNMSSTGIMVVESNLIAQNTIVGNCGDFSVYIGPGGSASFTHCTLANYFSLPNTATRQTPLMLFANYFYYQEEVNGPVLIYQKDIGNVLFANTILHGSLEEEVGFDLLPGTSFSNFVFDHCLIRTKQDTSSASFLDVIKNTDPRFHNRSKQDFRLGENSPAIGAGKADFAAQVPFDFEGNDRTQRFDLGAINYYLIPDDED